MRRFFKQNSKREGFTLIELLIVVTIIGILAAMSMVSLSSGRERTRDVRRLSDIKQLSNTLEIEDTLSVNTKLVGCVLKDDKISECTGPGDFGVDITTKLIDPSTKGDGIACSAIASAGACDYSITAANATTADYNICFYLEANSSLGDAGFFQISEGGAITARTLNCVADR
ncbi:type II secretion system GspH family protein [bacterium]|nr:type II secretion system GspH family protein [bacterium]